MYIGGAISIGIYYLTCKIFDKEFTLCRAFITWLISTILICLPFYIQYSLYNTTDNLDPCLGYNFFISFVIPIFAEFDSAFKDFFRSVFQSFFINLLLVTPEGESVTLGQTHLNMNNSNSSGGQSSNNNDNGEGSSNRKRGRRGSSSSSNSLWDDILNQYISVDNIWDLFEAEGKGYTKAEELSSDKEKEVEGSSSSGKGKEKQVEESSYSGKGKGKQVEVSSSGKGKGKQVDTFSGSSAESTSSSRPISSQPVQNPSSHRDASSHQDASLHQNPLHPDAFIPSDRDNMSNREKWHLYSLHHRLRNRMTELFTYEGGLRKIPRLVSSNGEAPSFDKDQEVVDQRIKTIKACKEFKKLGTAGESMGKLLSSWENVLSEREALRNILIRNHGIDPDHSDAILEQKVKTSSDSSYKRLALENAKSNHFKGLKDFPYYDDQDIITEQQNHQKKRKFSSEDEGSSSEKKNDKRSKKDK